MGKSYEGGRKRSTLLVTTRDKNIWLDVKASKTIADIKKMIEQQEGIRQSQQRLIYKGQVLADRRTLSIYKISKESVRDPAPNGERYNTVHLR